MRRSAAAVCAFLLVCMTSAEARPFAVDHSSETFSSGDRRVRLDRFTPVGRDRPPVVILLHGAGGWFLDGPAIRRLARTLAENGLTAVALHYFDRTGTLFARGASIEENFGAWQATLADAITHVAAQPGMEGRKIGCFGYSLGAYLALAQGAEDPRLHAVAELAGGIRSARLSPITRLPPLLILHGEQDERIPVARARELETLATRLDLPFAITIYPGEGHVLSRAAQEDAGRRAVAFFRKHLE